MKKIRATMKDVQRARAEWYVYHYEMRELAKQLPDDQRRAYQIIAASAAPPHLTVFGGFDNDYPPRLVYEVCGEHGLHAAQAVLWYLTPEGWDAFQRLWQDLPDPQTIYEPEKGIRVGDTVINLVGQIENPTSRLSTGTCG